MTVIALFLSLFTLMLLRVPIAVALGLSSLGYIILAGLPPVVLVHNVVNGMNSFTLLAVPFFIMAGGLMNSAGITSRIFAFARSLVGWLNGGLGHVNIGASIIFAGMSGAAVADAGGLGAIEIRAMREAGYDDEFSVGVTAASSTIGPIIPPSLPLVIFGVMASTSIGELFVAGIIPGLMMAMSLMIMVWFIARKRGYPKDAKFCFKRVKNTFSRAILPLMTPVIIVGGIVTGAFTPTEAAVCAATYALLLGLLLYRTLTLKKLIVVSLETIETTSSIMLIVGASTIFAWILTANQAAAQFAEVLLSISDNKHVISEMLQQAAFANSFDDNVCGADYWAVHGNHRSYIDPSSRSFANLSPDWHRSSTFGYHRYPQLDDRAADPTSRHGAVCFIQSFKCSI